MKSFIRWKLFVSELNWSWSLVKDVWVVIPEVFFTLVLRNLSSVFDDWNLTPVKNNDLDKGESKQTSLKLSTIDDETMSSSESHQLIFFSFFSFTATYRTIKRLWSRGAFSNSSQLISHQSSADIKLLSSLYRDHRLLSVGIERQHLLSLINQSRKQMQRRFSKPHEKMLSDSLI